MGRFFTKGRGSEIQDEADAVFDPPQELGRKRTDPLEQITLVHGHHLRDVGDGVLRQVCLVARQKYVPRGTRSPEVCGQTDDDDSPDAAAIEAVRLEDDDRPAVSWLGS
jgi:hypothetical protein